MDAKPECRDGGHDFVKLKCEWQTINRIQYQKLTHSKECFVCSLCGKIIDAFPEVNISI